MANQKRLPAAERREEILDHAMELFARKGFRGVRTRELAKACGVSEAMLYRFFSGKAELYAAIISRKSERVPEETYFPADAMERGDDAAVLRAFAMRLVRSAREDPAFMRLLFNSALEGHELARRFHRVRVAGLLERLGGYLERRRQEGALGPHDPRTAARAFAGQLMQLLLSSELFGTGPASWEEWEAEVDAMVGLLLDGLRARKEIEG